MLTAQADLLGELIPLNLPIPDTEMEENQINQTSTLTNQLLAFWKNFPLCK
jgi:hypothetical protein